METEHGKNELSKLRLSKLRTPDSLQNRSSPVLNAPRCVLNAYLGEARVSKIEDIITSPNPASVPIKKVRLTNCT